MNKCNIRFQTQYARVNGKEVCIDNYTKESGSPRCYPHDHELVAVHSVHRRSHFRHKHTSDTTGFPMTEWHIEWQSNFPITEQPFKNKAGQMKERRADIVLSEYRRIIEIQHSKIASGEVRERNQDYALHGFNVLWIINAQQCIEVKCIGNRRILEFKANMWLFESFLGCEYVYYDINGLIYKVQPSLIRSYQVDVAEPQFKYAYINALKTNTDLWEIIPEPPQSKIIIHQQGAGSGKTYGLMQSLNSDSEITCFKNIIFITKQHAAVNVMYTEFMNQYKNGDLNNLEIIEEPDNAKKYIVIFKNKVTNITCTAIFATVDSFTYALGEAPQNAYDKFRGIVDSIKEGTLKLGRNGSIKFAGRQPLLNKETLVAIDETQDLFETYGEAFLKLVTSNFPNLCVVGDLLQSLSYEKNALVYLSTISRAHVHLIKTTFNNTVRRFSHPRLISFVNEIIPFEKYGLPSMTAHEECKDESDALVVYPAKHIIYATSQMDDNALIEEVVHFMSFYSKEVLQYNRTPEEFMIITPFTAKNPLVDAICIQLNLFWKDIMENNQEYIENVKNCHPYWKDINTNAFNIYAVFHRSQDGTSINLNESTYATRIVSIHSSKGDGRNVVFVVGLNQSALQTFSREQGNLIYDSLTHVALTRQKQKLYIRLEENYDDIYCKMQSHVSEKHRGTTLKFHSSHFSMDNLFQAIDSNPTLYEELYQKICEESSLPPLVLSTLDNKKLITDTADHHIRYAAMAINIMIHQHNFECRTDSTVKKQGSQILRKPQSNMIRPVCSVKEYYHYLENNTKKNKDKLNKKSLVFFIPILEYTHNKSDRDYERYYTIIYTTMINVLAKFTKVYKEYIDYLCPFESVIAFYMIDCIENGKYHMITIRELYNIVHVYSAVFVVTTECHTKCACNQLFSVSPIPMSENINKYDHYERLQYMTQKLNVFNELHPNVNWLYNKCIKYDGKNTDFQLLERRKQMIGYNDTHVYNMTLQPSLSTINYGTFIIRSIIDTLLIMNSSLTEKVISNNKQIVCCVITLENDEIYEINITEIIKSQSSFFIDMVYRIMKMHYSKYHDGYAQALKNKLDTEKDITAIQIIENCIALCKCSETNIISPYMERVWRSIFDKIADAGKKKRSMLCDMIEKGDVKMIMDNKLDYTLLTYFGIKSDEEDEDEDEED
jgi:Pyruvate/2-oxoacid:ferredoxin oxidoreductase gamma subunit